MLFGQTRSVQKGTVIEDFYRKFVCALEDDLNIPQALAVVWEVITSNAEPYNKLATILDFDKVLGLGLHDILKYVIPQEIHNLIESRRSFRNESKFKEADKVRMQIENRGYRVEDTTSGTLVAAQKPLDMLKKR